MRAYKRFLLRSAMLALTFSTLCAVMARAEETLPACEKNVDTATLIAKQPPCSIDLTAGHVELFKFGQSVAQIAIGNPAIANIPQTTEMGKRAFLLNGMAVGETNLLVLDHANEEILRAMVRVARDADDVGKLVVVRGPFVGKRGPRERIIQPSGEIVEKDSDKGFTYTTIRCAPTCVEVDDSPKKIERTAPWPGMPKEKPGEEKPIEETSREQASR
jgi:hypothetical protein